MKKRKDHSPDFKACVVLEAIREESEESEEGAFPGGAAKARLTLAELSKNHGAPATQIGRWKPAAIYNMATAFTRRCAASEHVSAAEVDKLHYKIAQLLVECGNFCPLSPLAGKRLLGNGQSDD